MLRLALAVLLLCAATAARADPVSIIALAGTLLVQYGATAVGFALIVGSVAYGTVDARRKQRVAAARNRAAYNAALQDRTITALQADPPWRVIYGRAITGGDIVAVLTSDKTGYRENGSTYTKPDALKHLVIALATHEVAAIHEAYIDGKPLGALDGNGWVTGGEFYTAGAPDTRSVTVGAGSYLDVPEAVVTILHAYYTTGVGVDIIYVDVTPTLSIGNTRITNPDGSNAITVDYSIDHDSSAKASVRMSKHLGSSSQTVDTYLNGVCPSEWTTNDRLRGIAYVVLTLDLEEPRFQGGPPNVVFDVSGRLVYDPRTTATGWSANPALCIRDFLLSEWGMGCTSADVDDTYTNAAANACEVRQLAAVHAHAATCTASASTDELTFASDRWFGVGDGVRFTSSGTLPAPLAAGTTYYAIPGTGRTVFKFATSRANALAGTAINITSAGTGTHTGTWYDYDAYTCNGVFTTAQGREAVLDDLAESMGGWVHYGAQWLIQAGAWTASVMDLDDDDVHGLVEIAQGGAGMDEVFNTVRGGFVPAGGWAVADFDVYANATFVAADGQTLATNISLPFTDNKARCRNLARIFVERNRDSLVVRYPAKLSAWPLQVGDRVRVTSAEYGWSLKYFRVTDWDFNLQGAVVLTLQEDAAAIYDLADAASSDPAANSNLPDPWSVAALSSLTASSSGSTAIVSEGNTITPRVLVGWAAVSDPYVADGGAGRIEILWRRPGGPWQQVNVPGDSTSVYLVGANHGDRIVIEARARNSLGKLGPSAFVGHTVSGAAKVGMGDPGSFFDGFESATALDRWKNHTGSGELSLLSVSDAGSGAFVLRVGNNSGNDQAWLIHNANIPFDPTALYRIKSRIRRTAGTGTVYVGLAGVADDGTAFVNRSGSDSYSNQHYFAAAGAAPGSSWTEYTGYVRGTAATGTGSSAVTDPNAPGVMHEDVRYIRPLVVVNYSGAAGTTEVDFVSVERLGGQIGTDDLGDEAATELVVDEYDFGGTAYADGSGRSVVFTPAADCTIEYSVQISALGLDKDAGAYLLAGVTPDGGSTEWLWIPRTPVDADINIQTYTGLMTYAASGGVELTFRVELNKPFGFPVSIYLYECVQRMTAVKR